MTGENFVNVLDAADIRNTEAADIFRVSRGTISRWVAEGVTSTNPVLYANTEKTVKLLESAIAHGWLPVKDVKGKARLHEIKNAIRYAAAESVR